MTAVQPVSLHQAARERYLSYALSVITSRALPDVRDGLKPVQRRILYTMFHELSLHPGNRYRKSAAVVGEVMGKYHPHGDQSIYDALVRMAQDFSLRMPLVDPQGNFGSLDGDPPAAMRYTECKLTAMAEELLNEIKQSTVDFRATYDGQREEPIVLPATFPQLLVNGVEGIAVGLSTRIPPHNLGEVIDATIALIDGEAHSVDDLLDHIRGPDFPTGGRILNDRDELREIYENGKGSVRMRGEWTTEKEGRQRRIVITSIPYGQNKAKLIERIGRAVTSNKLPLLVDVRDESTEVVRIVLELKRGASAEAVMAYLYKHTHLETTFPVNLNALVPTDRPGVAVPRRLDLKSVLDIWLTFRYDTVRRRFEHELRKLRERIHILEGFAILFADIDEAIRIIRASEGRKDALVKLMEAFPLDEVQTNAILDLRLYKLARLEIQLILDELADKRAKAAEIERILGSETLMWGVIRTELVELKGLYVSPRRTTVGAPAKTLEYDETAYVVKEETFLIVTRDGWVKRQGSFTAVDKIRVKDHDEVGWILHTDTAKTVTFFTSDGSAYTLRVGDVVATTGYGDPIQRSFSFEDGATVVGVVAHDPDHHRDHPTADEDADDDTPDPPYVISVTRKGRIQRMPLAAFSDPSTRSGRRFAKLGKGDAVLAAYAGGGGEHVCVAARDGNVLTFSAVEANVLKRAGKGTTAIKLKKGDAVFAYELSADEGEGPRVHTNNGREVDVLPRRYGGKRGARGHAFIRRGSLERWSPPLIQRPPPGDDGEEDEA